ncbi:GNAT family N-acetyltransferase [Noviherbaspirillum malthae]|uniref:GNAT family N-acetyltransferase n=1 Tax=Noviherbaspirillum malthae TaxID=1260987 RepID=UPI00188E2B30|nr:GNAT family N-acetyltransferase [Noviherbaspirillum malthae]
MNSGCVTISDFENDFPDELERLLESLYHSPFATLAHHRHYCDLRQGVHAYVARGGKDGALAALLWRCDGRIARVLNEQIGLPQEEVSRFARHVFATHEDIDVIEFHAVHAEGSPTPDLPFPYQHFDCAEDIVLRLPDSVDAYRSSLGKSTRSYLSRYMNKLRRDHPDMRHEVLEKDGIDEDAVRRIVELNHARMQGRHRASYIDENEVVRVLELVRRYGLLTQVIIGGEVRAGAIELRLGNHYFLQVLAHDSAFNGYGLGTLCCYLAICECIARGGEEYHFLWGRYPYKTRLLGRQRKLQHIALYRDHACLARHGGLAVANVWRAARFRNHDWLVDRLHQPDLLGRGLRAAAQGAHAARGLLQLPRTIAHAVSHAARSHQKAG